MVVDTKIAVLDEFVNSWIRSGYVKQTALIGVLMTGK